MKIADLKYQSVTPANPSPNTLGLYADSGTANLLYTLVSGSVKRQVGITYTGIIPSVSIQTGQGQMATGIFFGGTGNGIVNTTGLGTPFAFLPVIHSNGMTLGIPAYLLA